MENLLKIINNDCLSSRNGQISFTRNKDFHKMNKIIGFRLNFSHGVNCRLVINGDKLSDNYEINPIRGEDFDSDDPKSKWNKIPKIVKKGKKYYSADESEERLLTKKHCIPIKKYIINIDLYDNDYLPSYINRISEEIKRNNIPFNIIK
jgi:hypothetical protein